MIVNIRRSPKSMVKEKSENQKQSCVVTLQNIYRLV